MSSRSSSNSTPRLTRKLYPGSSSPSTTQRYSFRRSSTPAISDQNSKIQKIKTKKKNSTSSSITRIRKLFNTATIDDKSSDEQMDDNSQLIATNNCDEEINDEIQIQNQPRQRLDSTASNKTEEPKVQKRTTRMTMEDVLKHFTKINNGLKCNLCVNSRKTFALNATSDSNLRRHLGGVHGLKEYLYPSQLQNYQPKNKLISTKLKQQLDKAAVQAIYVDGRSLNDFEKPGMAKFLKIAVPGYKGPTRKTVRRHLESLYKIYRAKLKKQLPEISDIGITCDVWKSSTRAYYICITAHYTDEQYKSKSFVLAFRRFLGSHTKGRLQLFILNEIKKLNIEKKVRGITTDNGPDIRAATSSIGLGFRLSCVVHLLNSTVKNGLWLHKIPKKKKKSASSSVNDQEQEEDDVVSIADSEDIPDEFLNGKEEEEMAEQEEKQVVGEGTEGEGTGGEGTEGEGTEGEGTEGEGTEGEGAEGEEEGEEEEGEEEETEELLTSLSSSSSDDEIEDSSSTSNSMDQAEQILINTADLLYEEFIKKCEDNDTILLSTIHSLLKRVRKVINFIHQSSVLDRYVKKHIELKVQEYNNSLPPDQKDKQVKYKDVVIDFEIRWNTTYFMLKRFIFFSSIITSITQNPSNDIGIKPTQYERLKRLAFSRIDWSILMGMKNVLKAFRDATVLLSGRKYATLGISYFVIAGLKQYLTTIDDNEPFENLLKKQLLSKFDYYFGCKFISIQQTQASLICAFLDPALYIYLSKDPAELEKAEKLVLQRAEFHRNLRQSRLHSTQVTLTTASNSAVSKKQEQHSQQHMPLLSLNNFLKTCGVQDTFESTPSFKINDDISVKEQISIYVANVKNVPRFETFWIKYGTQLPDLNSVI
ncbi:unnamed protein product, partial [Rotaria sp. Silwood1]